MIDDAEKFGNIFMTSDKIILCKLLMRIRVRVMLGLTSMTCVVPLVMVHVCYFSLVKEVMHLSWTPKNRCTSRLWHCLRSVAMSSMCPSLVVDIVYWTTQLILLR